MTHKLLRYRCQLLPERARKSVARAEAALLKSGWAREQLTDLKGALAWANSQILTTKQRQYRQKRGAAKRHLKGDDALDAMFRAAGADPATIPTRSEGGEHGG
jgi:hypothetical protein